MDKFSDQQVEDLTSLLESGRTTKAIRLELLALVRAERTARRKFRNATLDAKLIADKIERGEIQKVGGAVSGLPDPRRVQYMNASELLSELGF